MKTVAATIKGLSPLMFSKFARTPRKKNESEQDYEERTWRERMHVNPTTGKAYIPGMAFERSLNAAAKLLGEKSLFVLAGNAELNITPEEVERETLVRP